MAMCIGLGEAQSNCKPANGTLDGRGALTRLSIFIGGDGSCSIAADWWVYFAFRSYQSDQPLHAIKFSKHRQSSIR